MCVSLSLSLNLQDQQQGHRRGIRPCCYMRGLPRAGVNGRFAGEELASAAGEKAETVSFSVNYKSDPVGAGRED